MSYDNIYTGKVVDIKDPDKMGRIRVQIAELLGEEISAWCTPCYPNAQDNGGDFCLPQLNDYVWIMFEEGDIDQPVYLGGWWSEKNTPLGDEYKDADKVRVISFGDMFLVFDKKDNSISITTLDDKENYCELKLTPKGTTINMEDKTENNNLEVTVNKDKITLKGSDSTKVTVTNDKIVLDGKVSINGNLDIKGNINLDGSETYTGSISKS